jgi:hypothetical protein
MYYNEKHSETSCTSHTQPISKASVFFKLEKHITILVRNSEVMILFEDPGIDDWGVLKPLQKMGRENVE